MSKRKYDNPNQLNLFERIQKEHACQEKQHQAGSLDVNSRFRAAISEAIKNCPLSRAQIAARMSDLTGCDISTAMINSWTAESKEAHRFPAIFLPAFFEATKATWPYRVLAQPVGLYIMESPDALRSEVAAIDDQIKKLQQERRKRKSFLGLLERGKGNGEKRIREED